MRECNARAWGFSFNQEVSRVLINDLLIMTNPGKWPIPGVLPLKRVRNGKVETAVLLDSGEGVRFIRDVSPYAIALFADQLVGAPICRPLDLFNEGWRVD